MAVGTTILEVALAAWDAGLSVIPIRSDGSKKPALRWKRYQQARASREQVAEWFDPDGEGHRAIAVVCGAVSGHTYMVEMEGSGFSAGFWRQFRAACIAELGEDRWTEITAYVELSPSGGPHIYLRCPTHPGHQNTKLASRIVDGTLTQIMETRGEGGYSILGGSTGHPSGNDWAVQQGAVSDIATVTWPEFETILDCARSLDQTPREEPVDVPAPTPTDRASAGWMDDVIGSFNHRHDVLTYLPEWTPIGTEHWNGETVTRLRRDGSDNDHGAVLFPSGRVGFFSSNTPYGVDFYSGTGHMPTYDAFTIALLADGCRNTTEERVARARHLRDDGYGTPRERVAMNGEPILTVAQAIAKGREQLAEDLWANDDLEDDEPEVARLFTPVDWAALFAGDGPEEDWLVEPILPANRQVAIWASHKTGKSLLMLEMAAALATGRPCLLKGTTPPVDVVYLDMEMTQDDVRERLEDMGYGPDDDLSHLHYYLIPALPPLDTAEGGKVLVELAHHHTATVVVLDTMSRVTEGDENEADTYRSYYRYTGSRLKAAGIAVARLDHGGKDPTKGQRGSSAKGDDIDVAWQLVPSQDGILAKRNLSRMSWVPEQVSLTRSDDTGAMRHTVTGNSWPAGTIEAAKQMELAGIPVELPQRQAVEVFRAAGGQGKNALLRAAHRYRRGQGT